jgi:hypothetical protein
MFVNFLSTVLWYGPRASTLDWNNMCKKVLHVGLIIISNFFSKLFSFSYNFN